MDIYVDFKSEVSYLHLAQELALVTISLALFIYLMNDIFMRTEQSSNLQKQLHLSKHQQALVNEQLEDSKRNFFDAVHAEFSRWKLTAAEQDIALFLLKGFSVAQIALLMSKSEKTVRNQASSIYRKAEVDGRHELAAIFFEFWNDNTN